MSTDCSQQLTFWNIGLQQVTVDFDGGEIVTDTGLLAIRSLDQELEVLSILAERLPDPRSQKFVIHSREKLLTQQVYQILADYADCNDAQKVRQDPLFQTLVGRTPHVDNPLASGSTMARFKQACTRRQAELPLEERPVLLEVDAAQTHRLKILNDYLPELFIRTRRTPPASVIIDLDASDDPTHGQQVLSAFHGYFDQHQYFPLFAFEGETGFPLAAWLRPGTVHAGCGAVDVLKIIVDQLRQAWPNLTILVRGDNGLAGPGMYEYCETEGLLYAFGYAINNVLRERTDPLLADLEEYYHWYRHREPEVQRFEVIEDYQAGTWSQPRRIVAKIEINRFGSNRRFVVSNMSGHPQGIYHGFYVQRGEGAGTTHRRVEKWLVGGPPVVPPFSGQCHEIAGTHFGLCPGGVAPRSHGTPSRGGQSRGRYVTAAPVESRGAGEDELPTYLVPHLRNLAKPGSLDPRSPGPDGVCPPGASNQSCLTWPARHFAHVSFPKIRQGRSGRCRRGECAPTGKNRGRIR
jgi:hypothetical protein